MVAALIRCDQLRGVCQQNDLWVLRTACRKNCCEDRGDACCRTFFGVLSQVFGRVVSMMEDEEDQEAMDLCKVCIDVAAPVLPLIMALCS